MKRLVICLVLTLAGLALVPGCHVLLRLGESDEAEEAEEADAGPGDEGGGSGQLIYPSLEVLPVQ